MYIFVMTWPPTMTRVILMEVRLLHRKEQHFHVSWPAVWLEAPFLECCPTNPKRHPTHWNCPAKLKKLVQLRLVLLLYSTLVRRPNSIVLEIYWLIYPLLYSTLCCAVCCRWHYYLTESIHKYVLFYAAVPVLGVPVCHYLLEKGATSVHRRTFSLIKQQYSTTKRENQKNNLLVVLNVACFTRWS